MPKDITDQVDFQMNDDEYLPLTKCACGAVFEPWDFTLSIYKDSPHTCPHCGRMMYFSVEIRVYELE